MTNTQTIELLEKEKKQIIEEIDKKIDILKSKLSKNEWVKIPELGIEVQKNLAHKSIKYKDLIIPEGMRLMTLNEGIYIFDNKILDNFPDNNWEMIEQISKRNFELGYKVSALYGDWYFGIRLYVYGDGWVGGGVGHAFGVRFVRKLNARKGSKK